MFVAVHKCGLPCLARFDSARLDSVAFNNVRFCSTPFIFWWGLLGCIRSGDEYPRGTKRKSKKSVQPCCVDTRRMRNHAVFYSLEFLLGMIFSSIMCSRLHCRVMFGQAADLHEQARKRGKANVVTFSAAISACAQEKRWREALSLLSQMRKDVS